jgi:excinuclease UvrABC ATPase subunit
MATSKKSAKAIIDNDILVHGARTHNLKNVTVSFPSKQAHCGNRCVW